MATARTFVGLVALCAQRRIVQRRPASEASSAMVLTMEDIQTILAEELADDLPVGAHMLQWRPEDIRKYAEEGGFWSPPDVPVMEAKLSRAATRLSLDEYSWDTYEQRAIPLDSPGGAALAAAMSDPWAVRCSALMGVYEPQAERNWSCLASLVILLRVLQPKGEVRRVQAANARCTHTWAGDPV